MTIRVNAVEITEEQIFAEMQYHPSTSLQEAEYKAALALTIKELLCQEAKRLGILPPQHSNDSVLVEDYLVNQLIEQEIMLPEPTVEACAEYYQANSRFFQDAAGVTVPFEAVQSSIAEFLKESGEQQAVQQYIRALVDKAHIEGIPIDGLTAGGELSVKE